MQNSYDGFFKKETPEPFSRPMFLLLHFLYFIRRKNMQQRHLMGI